MKRLRLFMLIAIFALPSLAMAQKASHHNVIWDARDHGGRLVGSGVYYYMIKTDNFKANKKVDLLK